MITYLMLTVFWLIFFATHSALASSQIKLRVNNLHPLFKSYYRLFYNLISTIILAPIIYTYFKLPAEFILKPTQAFEILGYILVISATYILVAGFKNYRTDEFVGIYQIKNHHEFHPSNLSRTGWNSIVRHPLYFGGIILIVGLFLIAPTIKLGITGLLAITYLYIGTLWEEKKLISEFGSAYLVYQKEVSMILPIKWLLNKLS